MSREEQLPVCPLCQPFGVAGGRWQAAVGSASKGRNPLISLVITATYGFAQLHLVNWLLQASQTDWAERLSFNPFTAPQGQPDIGAAFPQNSAGLSCNTERAFPQNSAVLSSNPAGSCAKDQPAQLPAPRQDLFAPLPSFPLGIPKKRTQGERSEPAPHNSPTPQAASRALGLQQTHHAVPRVLRDGRLGFCLFLEGD